MLLKTLAAALPISAYPVLQLTFIGILLLFPLLSYACLLPYNDSSLNVSEIFLIVTGVLVLR